MVRVFVSSVSAGLEATRRQVIADLHTAGYDVSAMERFGAQPAVPIDVCLREARKSDVVVLLIGPRYGSSLPQGISYTQAEFREAQGAGIPVFAFRLADDTTLSDEERGQLASFATEVGSTTTYDSLVPGESFERLSPKVLAALSSARDRGEIAHRFSVFQKYDRFFAPHRSACAGRPSRASTSKDFLEEALDRQLVFPVRALFLCIRRMRSVAHAATTGTCRIDTVRLANRRVAIPR